MIPSLPLRVLTPIAHSKAASPLRSAAARQIYSHPPLTAGMMQISLSPEIGVFKT